MDSSDYCTSSLGIQIPFPNSDVSKCDTHHYLYLQGNKTAQKILNNVYKFFKDHFMGDENAAIQIGKLSNCLGHHMVKGTTKITSAATGVSLLNVKKYKDGPCEDSTKAPKRKRNKPATDVSNSVAYEIRQEIYDMYAKTSNEDFWLMHLQTATS